MTYPPYIVFTYAVKSINKISVPLRLASRTEIELHTTRYRAGRVITEKGIYSATIGPTSSNCQPAFLSWACTNDKDKKSARSSLI